MNIFIVHDNPKKAAQMLCDKHIVKMILESAQILSSVHWINNGWAPYKLTHKNHPCCVWARSSLKNYEWLMMHALALCEEYTFRYGKIHKTQEVIQWLILHNPQIEDVGLTEFAQAMPDKYKQVDPIEAYRNYYKNEKTFAKWKLNNVPEWFKK